MTVKSSRPWSPPTVRVSDSNAKIGGYKFRDDDFIFPGTGAALQQVEPLRLVDDIGGVVHAVYGNAGHSQDIGVGNFAVLPDGGLKVLPCQGPEGLHPDVVAGWVKGVHHPLSVGAQPAVHPPHQGGEEHQKCRHCQGPQILSCPGEQLPQSKAPVQPVPGNAGEPLDRGCPSGPFPSDGPQRGHPAQLCQLPKEKDGKESQHQGKGGKTQPQGEPRRSQKTGGSQGHSPGQSTNSGGQNKPQQHSWQNGRRILGQLDHFQPPAGQPQGFQDTQIGKVLPDAAPDLVAQHRHRRSKQHSGKGQQKAAEGVLQHQHKAKDGLPAVGKLGVLGQRSATIDGRAERCGGETFFRCKDVEHSPIPRQGVNPGVFQDV